MQGVGLPFGEAVRRVDAEDIRAGLDQGGHAVLIVAGVDAGADDQAFVAVEQLGGVLLVLIVVFAENHADQAAVLVDDRQLVDLVVPDDVVGFAQADAFPAEDQMVERGHELADLVSGGVRLIR